MSDREHLLAFCDAQTGRLHARIARLEEYIEASEVRATAEADGVDAQALRRELGGLRHQRERIAAAEAEAFPRLREAFESSLEVLTNDVERAVAYLSNPSC